MKWDAYENKKYLEPLCFSNNKTQEDIVNEILKEIEKGEKIIFLHGVCGTGKSLIALNLAKEVGKTSIVVPIKNLQAQYKKDYEDKKIVRKKTGEKLKINIITGRKNHKCKFLEENNDAIPRFKFEKNSRLNDIFAGKREQANKMLSKDKSADNLELPCKIEIKERNWNKIKEYLKQNNRINPSDFSKISDVKRMSIAPVCPYWSPVLPSKYEIKIAEKTKEYEGLEGNFFTQHSRKPGCPYYKQFDSYIDSDVIVFNSLKYKLETLLNRKPKTELEVIDECDEFLDKLSNQKAINIDRLQSSLVGFLGKKENQEYVDELFEIIRHIREKGDYKGKIGDIIELKRTAAYDILRVLLKGNWVEEADEDSYLFEVYEIAREFESFLNESYCIISDEKNLIFNVVTINLEKRFEEYIKKNKTLVLMSGTIHNKEVLREIFGIKDFKIIEAETVNQGEVRIKKTGLEKDCKYSNFSNGNHKREDYLLAMEKSLEVASRPTLVHVNAYLDLPSEKEKIELGLNYLVSREDLREEQFKDKTGENLNDFKKGRKDILFSTRDSRGVDFPGEQCRSIIFTKYPNPNVKDPFWKILMKTSPGHYWKFYKDKAKRELVQKVYRGVRSKDDFVELWSPDSRVLEIAEEEFK